MAKVEVDSRGTGEHEFAAGARRVERIRFPARTIEPQLAPTTGRIEVLVFDLER